MPVSLCVWRVRIGTFVRRKKKEYDYNHLLRELLNLMKKTENSRTAKDNKTSESSTAFHTGSSGTSNSSQYDLNANKEPSCAVSSPTGDGAVNLKTSCDVDSPGIHTVTESQSHVNISGCNAQSLHADGSKDTNHESGLTCKEEDAKEDSDCPDMNNMLILRSGDVERNPGPNDTPGNLTELELYLLAEEMDPSDFRKVGLALGFSEAKLSRFEKDHQTNSMHATYQMLYEWRKTVRESKARKILVSKLEHIRMMKLADNLRRGQIGEDIPTLTEEEISRVADDVKRYLSFELCQIQADPLNSELLLQFERIFTNLTLMEEDKGTRHKTPLLYDNLLKTKVNGFYPKRLLVEGEGGVGKTTLCAKIAWDWIHGVGYQDFRLVLVILLRKATDRTVGEIVKSYLSDNNPVTAKQLDKYILTHPDEVFLVLDGLDELAADLSSGQQLIQITLNRLFKSGTVLITSRQWRSDEIRKNPDLRKVFAFIAVEGFSAENLATYITKFFHPDKASSEDLNRFISGNDVIRENMAPFPIYTAMLCIMWKEFDGERRQAMCKLQTFSQLFDEMIGFLVDHYLSKCGTPSDISNHGEFRSEILDHLTSIGCVAFQGLQDRRLVFTEEEFQGCPESVNIGCKVGVLTKEKRILSRRERKKNSPSAFSSVQFPHKLFQEYLSGMYLASLYNSNRGEYERLKEDITENPREYQYLLYFTSAQQEEVGLDIASRLIDRRSRTSYEGSDFPSYRINPRSNVGDDFIVDVAYESQNPAVAKAVADHLRGRTLEIKEKMQAHTVSGHVFVFEHRKVDDLSIEKSCGRTVSGDLAEFMCTSPSLRSVTIKKAVHDVFYYMLANQAVHSKIETLNIHENLRERPSASRDLARFICKMPHLKKLTLITACHDDFYSTSASMLSSAKIETLYTFEDLRERPSASRDLVQFICKMPHLENLTLQTKYSDDFYSSSSSMPLSAKIETLNINCDPSASRDLAQFICKMPHLKNLTLNAAFHDDFYSTSASIAQSFKIETLNIHEDLRGRPSASRDVARFICKMSHLKNLNISTPCHDDFYSTSASMASSAKVETLDIYHEDFRERPSASRDLAQFICKMPHLKNMTLITRYHDDFYSISASMASSAKIETLDIFHGDLIERPSASRDLAQFICKMPHLKNLNLFAKYHDDFYSALVSMASSAMIETLDLYCKDLIERPSASRDLAQFICKMPHLKNLKLDSHQHQVSLHDDFYSTSASMASSAKVETLDINHEHLRERPSASRDLAKYICNMPHLKNLTLGKGNFSLHDDFYSTSTSMVSSAKVETLYIHGDFRKRPSVSRDHAQFICKMPHLKNLTLYILFHDDFYSTSASMASSAKIVTLHISCEDLTERPSASRDLAQFICKMPHLKNLTLRGLWIIHYKFSLHDDFYSSSASMASSAKIKTLHIENSDLKERPSASRDLAQFICKMPHLKNLKLDACCHDDFYSTSASRASSTKIETLNIHEDLRERPSASRDLAQFICKMPHLKNLTLNAPCHDDFCSTSASMASSARVDEQSANTCLTLTDLTMTHRVLQGWQDCGSRFDSVQRFTLQVWDMVHCDVIQRIKLPGVTELTVKTDEHFCPGGWHGDPAELSNAITNAFPKLAKVTFSNLRIGNSMMKSILQALRTNGSLKQLRIIRFTGCKTNERVDAFIRQFNKDEIIKVEIEHSKNCWYVYEDSDYIVEETNNSGEGIDSSEEEDGGIESGDEEKAESHCGNEADEESNARHEGDGTEDDPEESESEEKSDYVRDHKEGREDMKGNHVEGLFDHQGGELCLETHGCILCIPPEALEEESPMKITLEVLTELPDDLELEEDEMVVSPGFRCLPSGLHFKKPVKLIMPHCAVLHDPERVKTVLHSWSHEIAGKIERIPQTPSTCKVHNSHFELMLEHFSDGWLTMIWNWLTGKGKLMCCMPYLPNTMPASRKPVVELRLRNKPNQALKYARGRLYQPALDEDYQIMIERKKLKITCDRAQEDHETEILECGHIFNTDRCKVALILDLQRNQENTAVTLKLIQTRTYKIIFDTGCMAPFDAPHVTKETEVRDPVTDGKLNTLSTRVPPEKYTVLSEKLGIEYNEAQISLKKHNNDYEMAIRECFAIWKNRTGGSLAVLREILSSSGLFALSTECKE